LTEVAARVQDFTVRSLHFLSSSHAGGLNSEVNWSARACPALMLREETAGRTIHHLFFNAQADGAAFITVDNLDMESNGK